MKGNRKWLQIAILLAIVVIGGYALSQSLFSDSAKPKEGGKAPEFNLHGLDGRTHALSDYKGKTLVINFWASWCVPCKSEMPAIQRQYDKWKVKGLEVMGVNLGESVVSVQSFVRQLELTFPVFYDPDFTVRDRYGVVTYPTTFFVDAQGNIKKIQIGEMDEPFIEQTVAGMLGR